MGRRRGWEEEGGGTLIRSKNEGGHDFHNLDADFWVVDERTLHLPFLTSLSRLTRVK